MPLREARAGQEAHLVAIRLEPRDREHLYRQGLEENRRVRILHNDHRGRVMLRLGEDIFLLGRRETPRIQIREILVD
jgi:Fe2+ transport system protein FeoA